jgi:hypothetical protein
MVYLIPAEKMNRMLAKDQKVQAAVESAAKKIFRRATSYLNMHRDTGAAKIELERRKNLRYGHIDWFVSLVDEAALSIEFGHYVRISGGYKRVDGLYIITQAYLNA